jgi:NAD(P)-dependent dehydrogenase (short-subunit alcohol dehydrogenase family)
MLALSSPLMGQLLLNKVAIVTGASRGIGRAIALKLAENGAAVMLAARNAELLKGVRAEIESKGGKAAWLSLDLRKPEASALLAEKTLEELSGIDIVVNNAGATKRGDFLTLSEEDWTDGFALKFFGAVRLVRAAWPILKKRKGSLVNIAGVGGRTPGAQFTIGGSVNAAMLSFTKAMADVGVGDGVQVNAINPGAVRTARLLARLQTLSKEHGISDAEAETQMVADSGITKIGEPEDVANLVAYLVSPQNRYLHGALIDLDGGTTKTM